MNRETRETPERKGLATTVGLGHVSSRAKARSFESATPVGWQKTSPRVRKGSWDFLFP
jgi:hypothetical protein